MMKNEWLASFGAFRRRWTVTIAFFFNNGQNGFKNQFPKFKIKIFKISKNGSAKFGKGRKERLME